MSLLFLGTKFSENCQSFLSLALLSWIAKNLLTTLFTFPSRIGYFFLKAIDIIAPAVDLPMPGN